MQFLPYFFLSFFIFFPEVTQPIVCAMYGPCCSELICVGWLRHKPYGFKKSFCIASKSVTCCCLVSVRFFSTLIPHKMFNLKTLGTYRIERNWQSQLRLGFSAVVALSLGEAWEKATFGKTCNSILLHFVYLWSYSWTGSLFQISVL